jgi:hypothetical protein
MPPLFGLPAGGVAVGTGPAFNYEFGGFNRN